jgi:hypothetical protein
MNRLHRRSIFAKFMLKPDVSPGAAKKGTVARVEVDAGVVIEAMERWLLTTWLQ